MSDRGDALVRWARGFQDVLDQVAPLRARNGAMTLHTHQCAEPSCTARIGCLARQCRECEDARHCEAEHAHLDDVICEDHRDMPPCAWCGEREGDPLMEHDGDQIHPACRAEMTMDRADYLRDALARVPEFCLQRDACTWRGYCRRDPACTD